MDTRKVEFLKAVVGDQGAAALIKAAARSVSIENVLVPRAIMAWLGVIGRFDYEGEIPGVDDTYLDFAKNEDGLYDGSIAVGDGVFPFENANGFQLAASIAVALGSDQPLDEVRDSELARLGKSIDIMAKAKMVTDLEIELAKARPGPPNPQKPQGPPTAATPQMKQPKMQVKPPKTPKGAPKNPIAPKAKVSLPKPPNPAKMTPGAQQNRAFKSEKQFALNDANLLAACPECGLKLIKNEKFVGCMCLRDLAKNVALTKYEGRHYISFRTELDADAVSVVLETLGVK
jgi:hypothetical protein